MLTWQPTKAGKQENKVLNQELAKSLVTYEPATGSLTWKKRGDEWFKTARACNAWNARFAGKPCGSVNRMGYVHLSVNGTFYQAHRLIWLIVYGDVWLGDIDHINGVKSDNRLENLRAVTHADNGRNRSIGSNNTSGSIGVGWNKLRGKWQARIGLGGISKSLGYFDNFDAAVEARKDGQRFYGFHENHGRPA